MKLGDEIEVLLEHIEDDNGMVVLSHEKAEQKKNWDRICSACSEGGTIEGKDPRQSQRRCDHGFQYFTEA
mgnify:CR=1 FL=1